MHRPDPGPTLTASLSVFPAFECRRSRRPYRAGFSGPRIASGTFLEPGGPARRRGLAIAAQFNGQPRVGRVSPLRRA